MVVAGVAIGIARQSIAAFGIGVASALGLVNAPTIVDNIVTATMAQKPGGRRPAAGGPRRDRVRSPLAHQKKANITMMITSRQRRLDGRCRLA